MRRPYEHSIIDPNIIRPDGQLNDFDEQRPGDPRPPNVFTDKKRARTGWGSIRKLERNTSNNKATVISIDDLGRSYPINVQLRFALDDGHGNPALPWVNTYSDVSGNLTITRRRGLSPDGAVSQDIFTMDGATGVAGSVLPFDIVTARSLGLDIQLNNAAADLWIESIATEVEDISTQNKILGWNAGSVRFLAQSNVFTQFLFAHPDRVQFIICNTSTTGDLYLGFGVIPVVGGVGTMVLPKNTFATYESPVGGWRGDVFGVWDVVGAGSALITEGVFF